MGKLIFGRFPKLSIPRDEYISCSRTPVLRLVEQKAQITCVTCMACQSEITEGYCRRCADLHRFRRAQKPKLCQVLKLMGINGRRAENLLSCFLSQETFDGVIAFLLTDIAPLTEDLPLTPKIKKAGTFISLLIEQFDERKRVPYATLS